MTPQNAEALAVQALEFLASDTELLGHFLAQSGGDPGALRDAAQNPEFLGFVLDFILLDDATVLALAERANRPPEDIARARAALPGGDQPNWT